MTANYLAALAAQMQTAAERLQADGDRWKQNWAAHLLADRKSILMMAATLREPDCLCLHAIEQIAGEATKHDRRCAHYLREPEPQEVAG